MLPNQMHVGAMLYINEQLPERPAVTLEPLTKKAKYH